MEVITHLGAADMAALGIFIGVVSLYGFVADHSALRRHSIASAMNRQRHNWMEQARRRELRMLDSNILHILMFGISVFASTNIFVIGGLIAGVTYSERLAEAFSKVPFAVETPPALWSLKLALLIVIFVYAFFKFAWAIRLANYCAIAVGALKSHDDAEDDLAADRVEAAAKLSALCAYHFNRGLRANFFGLAALGWFLSPWVFIGGTLFSMLILIRREFFSGALAAVKHLD